MIVLSPILPHRLDMNGRQSVVSDVADGEISIAAFPPGGSNVFDGMGAAVVFTTRGPWWWKDNMAISPLVWLRCNNYESLHCDLMTLI